MILKVRNCLLLHSRNSTARGLAEHGSLFWFTAQGHSVSPVSKGQKPIVPLPVSSVADMLSAFFFICDQGFSDLLRDFLSCRLRGLLYQYLNLPL